MSNRNVIVVGGGFGGLSTAIRLQAGGCQVTLLERRDRIGGRAYVYEDAGFTFDAGPTVITAPNCIEELFQISGKSMSEYIELMPVSPFYRLCWEDGFRFDYSRDLDETLRQIRAKSPGDVEGYRRFLDYTREVFDQGYTKLAHVPFLHWSSMVKVSPHLMRLQAYRSVHGVVSRFLRDPQLRQAFSFHSLLVGGNPFHTSAIYTLIHYLEREWGVFFAKGGTGALVQALGKLFSDLGGRIVTDCEVDRIAVAENGVKGVVTKQNQFMAADTVVSNADVRNTYAKLLRDIPQLDSTRRKLDRARYSMSLFVLYFGTNRRYENVAHHNILFGNRYKELLREIFKGSRLPDDFSLYLHAPTVTDPSLAPEGCEAFYVLSPVPHLGNADIDWKTEGPRYADRILAYLEKNYLPDLRRSVVTQRHFTPADFKTELDAHLGSAFSLEPTLTQSAYFRVHNRDPKIRGLYFAGAGTHPGAGLPGVISSGKATAGLVLTDLAPVPRDLTVAADTIRRANEVASRSIRKGSLSFHLASRVFDPDTRQAAGSLYAWCRHCDDQIDETVNLRLQEVRLERLKADTRAVFDDATPSDPTFLGLQQIVHRYGIPQHYPLELLAGMEMDVKKERFWTFDELRLYAYRVAGTVGLMMCHVMKVSDERALRHACDLGIAMQLTNIARDVMDDFAKKRIYLPLEWLDAVDVDENRLDMRSVRPQVFRVVERLLDEADRYYDSANAGLKYLDLRCAWAVASASSIYREIGNQVRRRKENAWDSRTIVPGRRKLVLMLNGAWLAMQTIPHRLSRVAPYASPRFLLRHT